MELNVTEEPMCFYGGSYFTSTDQNIQMDNGQNNQCDDDQNNQCDNDQNNHCDDEQKNQCDDDQNNQCNDDQNNQRASNSMHPLLSSEFSGVKRKTKKLGPIGSPIYTSTNGYQNVSQQVEVAPMGNYCTKYDTPTLYIQHLETAFNKNSQILPGTSFGSQQVFEQTYSNEQKGELAAGYENSLPVDTTSITGLGQEMKISSYMSDPLIAVIETDSLTSELSSGHVTAYYAYDLAIKTHHYLAGATDFIKRTIDLNVQRQNKAELHSVDVTNKIISFTNNCIKDAEDRQRSLLVKLSSMRLVERAMHANEHNGLQKLLSDISQKKNDLQTYSSQMQVIPSKLASTCLEIMKAINTCGQHYKTLMRSSQNTKLPSFNELIKDTDRPQALASLVDLSKIGRAIPDSTVHVTIKGATRPSISFGYDGSEVGQVSRPWGVCTNKYGNIIIADRRNHRIQIFDHDGNFLFTFGEKGSDDGQFDLPAGITTDPKNRIIVVDKDNHRIQIFTYKGEFILKFGKEGTDYGDFQYPWDVAVNASSEILVTDTRNRRIQLFNYYGKVLAVFCFYSRTPKNSITPRGTCFTPQGDVLVTDFDNHRLLLIDKHLKQVLQVIGTQYGMQMFNRPSGLCCDDNGNIVVCDSKNGELKIFTHDLVLFNSIKLPIQTRFETNIDRPVDVALLPLGNILVTIESNPDNRSTKNPVKKFIHIF